MRVIEEVKRVSEEQGQKRLYEWVQREHKIMAKMNRMADVVKKNVARRRMRNEALTEHEYRLNKQLVEEMRLK